MNIAGDPSDLNSERHSDPHHAHTNGVAANEALVLAAASRYPNVNFYGMNPGFVQTDIHASKFDEGSLKYRIFDLLIGLIFGGPDDYVDRIAPLLLASELEQYSGVMFNKAGQAVHASPVLTDPRYVQMFMDASEELAGRAIGAALSEPAP